MANASFRAPELDACVSSFAAYQGRLIAPFRITLRGVIGDLQTTVPSRSGNDKRTFRLYDSDGDFISCCAQGSQCQSKALRHSQKKALRH